MKQPTPDHKFYVYNYVDPRPGREGDVIYVGKGTFSKREGLKRMGQHWASWADLKNLLFANVLRKISEAGLEPIRKVASWHTTEEEAFSAEISGVSLHRLRKHGGTLCNLTLGGEGPSGMVHGPAALSAIAGRSRELWADPAYAERRNATLRATLSTPESKSLKSKEAARRWGNPEFKAKNSAAIKAARSTSEARAQTSEINKAIWGNPGMREAFSARMREVLNNPEEKARKSAATKAKWADPEFRAKMLAARTKHKT